MLLAYFSEISYHYWIIVAPLGAFCMLTQMSILRQPLLRPSYLWPITTFSCLQYYCHVLNTTKPNDSRSLGSLSVPNALISVYNTRIYELAR